MLKRRQAGAVPVRASILPLPARRPDSVRASGDGMLLVVKSVDDVSVRSWEQSFPASAVWEWEGTATPHRPLERGLTARRDPAAQRLASGLPQSGAPPRTMVRCADWTGAGPCCRRFPLCFKPGSVREPDALHLPRRLLYRELRAERLTDGRGSAGRPSRSSGRLTGEGRSPWPRDPAGGASRPYSNTMIMVSCVSPTTIRPGSPARRARQPCLAETQERTARLPQPSPVLLPRAGAPGDMRASPATGGGEW